MDLCTAFILGLVGSLHCAGMCGPLTLALPAKNCGSSSYFLGRLFYNAGRILTYGALGLIFGLVGKTLFLAGIQQWVSIALGITLLLGLFGSKKLALKHPAYKLIGQVKFYMGAMLHRRQSLASLAILGLLNGLLPCGLVYVAAAGAVTTGSLIRSVGYMAAFGVGTLPMMLGIGLLGKLAPISFRLKLQSAIPVTVFLLATLLILRGMSLGIPYLSPDLSSSTGCHK